MEHGGSNTITATTEGLRLPSSLGAADQEEGLRVVNRDEELKSIVLVVLAGAIGDLESLNDVIGREGPIRSDGSRCDLVDLRLPYRPLRYSVEHSIYNPEGYWRELSDALGRGNIILVTWELEMERFLVAREVSYIKIGPVVQYDKFLRDWEERFAIESKTSSSVGSASSCIAQVRDWVTSYSIVNHGLWYYAVHGTVKLSSQWADILYEYRRYRGGNRVDGLTLII